MPELPLYQTTEGCGLLHKRHRLLTVRGVQVGIQVSRPRIAPWLTVLIVPRFGRGIPPALLKPIALELAEIARNRQVLRLHIEGYTEEPEQLAAISMACAEAGFKLAPPRSYTHTIWLDLSPEPEKLLAGLPKKARRDILVPVKKGYEVRRIRSHELAPAIQRLAVESFARTGAIPPKIDWERWILLSLERPHLLRIVGLFAASDSSSENPLAFATAVKNGDVAEYAHAGSAPPDNVNIPLLYAPTWDLISWGRSVGARWWDFGGVSQGSGGETDARAGINAFKLYFSKNVIRVGREWVVEPRPTTARVIRAIRSHILRRR